MLTYTEIKSILFFMPIGSVFFMSNNTTKLYVYTLSDYSRKILSIEGQDKEKKILSVYEAIQSVSQFFGILKNITIYWTTEIIIQESYIFNKILNRLITDPEYRKNTLGKLYPSIQDSPDITDLKIIIVQEFLNHTSKKPLSKSPNIITKEDLILALNKIPKEVEKIKLASSSTKFLSLQQALSKRDRCSIEEYETYWNSEKYNPLIATFIYTAGITDKIPKQAMINKADNILRFLTEKYREIKLKIDSKIDSEPPFISIYNSIAKHYNYSYCKETFNFLIEFQENGRCNCECGSYLVYQINELFPSPNFITLFSSEPDHVKIFVYNKLTRVQYTCETTNPPIQLTPLKENSKNYSCIFSEQLLAFNILLSSVESRFKSENKDIFREFISTINNMIGNNLDIQKSPLEDLILGCDRKMLNTKKTPSPCMMDNTTLNILIFTKYAFIHKIPNVYEKIFNIGTVYTPRDLKSLYENISPTPEEIQTRNKEMLKIFKIILKSPRP